MLDRRVLFWVGRYIVFRWSFDRERFSYEAFCPDPPSLWLFVMQFCVIVPSDPDCGAILLLGNLARGKVICSVRIGRQVGKQVGSGDGT